MRACQTNDHMFQCNTSILYFSFPFTHIVVDEVEVMPGCDSHGTPTSLEQTTVGLMQSLVDVHKGVDDGLSVVWGLRNFRKHSREQIWTHILQRGGRKHRL